MKKRNLVIGLLVTLAIALSGATFAYWAASVGDASDNGTTSITIGEGGEATTSVTVGGGSSSRTLVPSGNEDEPTTYYYEDVTYSVAWDAVMDEANLATGTLAVSVVSIEISSGASDGQDVYSTGWNLFTAVVQSGDGAITEGTPASVVVRISFANEPANQTQYDAIANQSIEVVLSFSVTAD